jgi:hypothetical protein
MQILSLFRLSSADVVAFEAYEAIVLPLLTAHGGVLLKRLRSEDATVEAHLLEFEDPAGLQAYRADPIRVAAQDQWRDCRAAAETWTVFDVPSVVDYSDQALNFQIPRGH